MAVNPNLDEDSIDYDGSAAGAGNRTNAGAMVSLEDEEDFEGDEPEDDIADTDDSEPQEAPPDQTAIKLAQMEAQVAGLTQALGHMTEFLKASSRQEGDDAESGTPTQIAPEDVERRVVAGIEARTSLMNEIDAAVGGMPPAVRAEVSEIVMGFTLEQSIEAAKNDGVKKQLKAMAMGLKQMSGGGKGGKPVAPSAAPTSAVQQKTAKSGTDLTKDEQLALKAMPWMTPEQIKEARVR